MPRLPAEMRISLKKRGGATYRIELIRQPGGTRFWVRRDGVRSKLLPDASATQLAERIRQWILAEAKPAQGRRRAKRKKGSRPDDVA